MAFKCEKVSESLKIDFYYDEFKQGKDVTQTSVKLSLDGVDYWWRDRDRGIIAWKTRAHIGRMADGDYSQEFIMKFIDKEIDNVIFFVIEPGYTLYDDKNSLATYVYEKILNYKLCDFISLEEALQILRDLLNNVVNIIDNSHYPNRKVIINF